MELQAAFSIAGLPPGVVASGHSILPEDPVVAAVREAAAAAMAHDDTLAPARLATAARHAVGAGLGILQRVLQGADPVGSSQAQRCHELSQAQRCHEFMQALLR
jgi:hypothetical protein